MEKEIVSAKEKDGRKLSMPYRYFTLLHFLPVGWKIIKYFIATFKVKALAERDILCFRKY